MSNSTTLDAIIALRKEEGQSIADRIIEKAWFLGHASKRTDRYSTLATMVSVEPLIDEINQLVLGNCKHLEDTIKELKEKIQFYEKVNELQRKEIKSLQAKSAEKEIYEILEVQQ